MLRSLSNSALLVAAKFLVASAITAIPARTTTFAGIVIKIRKRIVELAATLFSLLLSSPRQAKIAVASPKKNVYNDSAISCFIFN